MFSRISWSEITEKSRLPNRVAYFFAPKTLRVCHIFVPQKVVASLVEARLKDVRLSTVKLRFTPPDSRLTLGSFGGDLATTYVQNLLP